MNVVDAAHPLVEVLRVERFARCLAINLDSGARINSRPAALGAAMLHGVNIPRVSVRARSDDTNQPDNENDNRLLHWKSPLFLVEYEHRDFVSPSYAQTSIPQFLLGY